VAADWHDVQYCSALFGRPSSAPANSRIRGAASRHTTVPVSHVRPSSCSPLTTTNFALPLRVGGRVELSSRYCGVQIRQWRRQKSRCWVWRRRQRWSVGCRLTAPWNTASQLMMLRVSSSDLAATDAQSPVSLRINLSAFVSCCVRLFFVWHQLVLNSQLLVHKLIYHYHFLIVYALLVWRCCASICAVFKKNAR